MNGAARLLAEAGVSFGVVKVKMAASKVFKLVLGEAQFSRDIVHLIGRALSWAGVKGMALWLSSWAGGPVYKLQVFLVCVGG